MNKTLLFLTGTRADFGKLKPLMHAVDRSSQFNLKIFATGMHMHQKYGFTLREIYKAGFSDIYPFINHTSETSMDLTLAKTIEGISAYIKEYPIDLLVVHGDRVEAMAGAIVGALNNICVAHIEGGELSGTIDDLIRHSVSKMSHVHFVSNDDAKKRLIQLGEAQQNIHCIGSPDIDVMFSDELPPLEKVKDYYDIEFSDYAIAMFHPVTTEYPKVQEQAKHFVDSLIAANCNFILIYPNNDLGSSFILKEYHRLENHPRFRIFPSIRFEYFLVLLRFARFIIGNSSAGIREAPAYGVPSINIGSRQNNRTLSNQIINSGSSRSDINNAIEIAIKTHHHPPQRDFGEGNSTTLFMNSILTPDFWAISKQKNFVDL